MAPTKLIADFNKIRIWVVEDYEQLHIECCSQRIEIKG